MLTQVKLVIEYNKSVLKNNGPDYKLVKPCSRLLLPALAFKLYDLGS